MVFHMSLYPIGGALIALLPQPLGRLMSGDLAFLFLLCHALLGMLSQSHVDWASDIYGSTLYVSFKVQTLPAQPSLFVC